MRGFQYLQGVTTLQLDRKRCIGCGACVQVCPHRLFFFGPEGLEIHGRDLCMECGACAQNCPVEAVTVRPGVGCAVAILGAWVKRIFGKKIFSDCC